MTPSKPGAPSDERLLTFEVGDALYALPISAIVEVAEVEEGFAAVPTLPLSTGGAINFHGDALPVLRSDVLLGVPSAELSVPAQIVVLSDGPSEKARMGLPVDEVLGLVSGPRATSRGGASPTSGTLWRP